jgi:uncharacterized protein (DUF1330 family)
MSVYVIVQGEVGNQGLLDQYVAKAGRTIKSHQGRTIAFDDEPEVVEGKIEYPRTVIVEFPSLAAFRAWYNSRSTRKSSLCDRRRHEVRLSLQKDFRPLDGT